MAGEQRHYFNAPAGEGEVQTHLYEVGDIKLRLKTSAGIFAKRGLDFGTALLIEAILAKAQGNHWHSASFLDLGAGNGVIAAFLAEAQPELKIYASEISPRAVEIMRENLKRYAKVEVIEADGVPAKLDQLDYISLNPPIRAGKEVCYRLYREAYAALKTGGSLFIVIRKQQGALSHKRELEAYFSEISELVKKKGYFVFEARKL